MEQVMRFAVGQLIHKHQSGRCSARTRCWHAKHDMRVQSVILRKDPRDGNPSNCKTNRHKLAHKLVQSCVCDTTDHTVTENEHLDTAVFGCIGEMLWVQHFKNVNGTDQDDVDKVIGNDKATHGSKNRAITSKQMTWKSLW